MPGIITTIIYTPLHSFCWKLRLKPANRNTKSFFPPQRLSPVADDLSAVTGLVSEKTKTSKGTTAAGNEMVETQEAKFLELRLT